MSVVHHIYPKDMYRAAALQAYLSRGHSIIDAVNKAIEAADLMQAEVDERSDYELY